MGANWEKTLKKVWPLCLFILLSVVPYTSHARGKVQFHFDFGQDNPDEGEERESNSTMVKLSLVKGAKVFRLGSGFTYLTGSNQFSQGEFTIGPYLYPLGATSKSPVQPMFYAVGKLGFGTLADESRMDTGYGLGVGIDIYFFKSSGISIAVEQHNASESATRLWVGFHWN